MALHTEELRSYASNTALPWGGEGPVLSVAGVTSLANTHSLSCKAVEKAALEGGVYPARYLRNMQGISVEGQIRLLDASIAQVGLGGLGGTLLDIFLRAGVGHIRAADGDHFEDSNLNRQALSTPENLMQPKSDAASARAEAINPSVHFEGLNRYLDPESMPAFVDGCDLIIDALGGLSSRLHLQHAATEAHIPMITGALAGWTGYVGCVRPGSLGPADLMGNDNAAEEALGCPAPAVTFIASIMATEAIKLLTNDAPSLEGKMLIVDLKTFTFETISL